MMLSSEASCSDCIIELIEKKWTKLMLKWINNCVYENGEVRRLNTKCLSDLMTKYKKDACVDDIEAFIKYKYPKLRLRYLSEDRDTPKKLYIMTAILLYDCFVDSQSDAVDEDITKHLAKCEQELLLRYCEKLSEMEITINNVETAIRDAFESLYAIEADSKSDSSVNDTEISKSSFAHMSAVSTIKSSGTTLPSDSSSLDPDTVSSNYPIGKFASSVTVIPSTVIDTSEVKSSSDSIGEIRQDTAPTRELSDLNDLPRPIDSDKVLTTEKQKKKTSGISFNIIKRDPVETETEQLDIMKDAFMTRAKNPINVSEDEYLSEMGCVDEMAGAITQRENIVNLETNSQNTVPVEFMRMFMKDTSAREGAECQKACPCTRCLLEKTSCGEPGGTMDECRESMENELDQKKPSKEPHTLFDCLLNKNALQDLRQEEPGESRSKKPTFIKLESKLKSRINFKSMTVVALIVIGTLILLGILLSIFFGLKKKPAEPVSDVRPVIEARRMGVTPNVQKLVLVKTLYQDQWKCENNVCVKVHEPTFKETFSSHEVCLLKCSGPQIWPLPTGITRYSDEVILLSTNKLQYRFDTVLSDNLRTYLAEAFKLFMGDLAKMEVKVSRYRNWTQPDVKKVMITIDISSDPDPRLRLDTDEGYSLKIDLFRNRLEIMIASKSFCGARHALETLSQMILMDSSTGYLVTVASAEIKDTPSFRYRGLMMDTGRNYIPVPDIMRTIDGMATVKLNTFHWRISDVTSFPLLLPKYPQLFEYGAYDRSMVYTKKDVKTIVKRAWIRGIRVVMEVAAPGPVGRPWSWSRGVTCSGNRNESCDNVLCLKLQPQPYVLNIFEAIYMDIIEMTQVQDVFHLSHGVFSLVNCYDLMTSYNGYLEAILVRLKKANKGLLPKLPIIWHSFHLDESYEAKTWEYFGVQLSEWKPENFKKLTKYKLIFSAKWLLSCEIKNFRCKRYRAWQEMYSWKPWTGMEAFSIEGGEALLWTDLVNSHNLDYHLWPRLVAMAERLWSNAVINETANSSVYLRLNSYRYRLQRDNFKVQPIWPSWCFNNPLQCLSKIV